MRIEHLRLPLIDAGYPQETLTYHMLKSVQPGSLPALGFRHPVQRVGKSLDGQRNRHPPPPSAFDLQYPFLARLAAQR
jgi:hypothetical protein